MATRMHPAQVRVGESSVPGDGRRGWLSSRVGQSWVEAADGRVWPVGRTAGVGLVGIPVVPGAVPEATVLVAGCEGRPTPAVGRPSPACPSASRWSTVQPSKLPVSIPLASGCCPAAPRRR